MDSRSICFVHYKVCDEGEYTLLDKDNKEIVSVQSYVPYVLYPEDEAYGDYIIMSVDENGFIKTGFVIVLQSNI